MNELATTDNLPRPFEIPTTTRDQIDFCKESKSERLRIRDLLDAFRTITAGARGFRSRRCAGSSANTRKAATSGAFCGATTRARSPQNPPTSKTSSRSSSPSAKVAPMLSAPPATTFFTTTGGRASPFPDTARSPNSGGARRARSRSRKSSPTARRTRPRGAIARFCAS